jgi:hypothetical protein
MTIGQYGRPKQTCGTVKSRPSRVKVNYEKFNLTKLKEYGMLQYFYHSPSSELPIRDVRGENKKGKKTEPHIEIGAENYLEDCYQSNIKRLLHSDAKYLFLLTTCRNKEMNDYYGNQYIIGYIIKEEFGFGEADRENSVFVKGTTKLFGFQDSISSKKLFGTNLGRDGILTNLFVNTAKTERTLAHFLSKREIPLVECMREINRLDRKKETCYFDRKCKHVRSCTRFS